MGDVAFDQSLALPAPFFCGHYSEMHFHYPRVQDSRDRIGPCSEVVRDPADFSAIDRVGQETAAPPHLVAKGLNPGPLHRISPRRPKRKSKPSRQGLSRRIWLNQGWVGASVIHPKTNPQNPWGREVPPQGKTRALATGCSCLLYTSRCV